ncbi:hypothetical protein GGI05_006795, partial [Coemansia sp. RSA 2603]
SCHWWDAAYARMCAQTTCARGQRAAPGVRREPGGPWEPLHVHRASVSVSTVLPGTVEQRADVRRVPVGPAVPGDGELRVRRCNNEQRQRDGAAGKKPGANAEHRPAGQAVQSVPHVHGVGQRLQGRRGGVYRRRQRDIPLDRGHSERRAGPRVPATHDRRQHQGADAVAEGAGRFALCALLAAANRRFAQEQAGQLPRGRQADRRPRQHG